MDDDGAGLHVAGEGCDGRAVLSRQANWGEDQTATAGAGPQE